MLGGFKLVRYRGGPKWGIRREVFEVKEGSNISHNKVSNKCRKPRTIVRCCRTSKKTLCESLIKVPKERLFDYERENNLYECRPAILEVKKRLWSQENK